MQYFILLGFIIGLLTGLFLIYSCEYKHSIGYCIIFLSTTNLYENTLFIYPNSIVVPKLLMINIGMIGFVFFSLVQYIETLDLLYNFFFTYFFWFILLKAILLPDISGWNFLTLDVKIIYSITYFMIFNWIYTSDLNHKKMFYTLGRLMYLSFFFSFTISYFYSINLPIMWNTSFLFLSPILLLT
jgi:hypothetical protein